MNDVKAVVAELGNDFPVMQGCQITTNLKDSLSITDTTEVLILVSGNSKFVVLRPEEVAGSVKMVRLDRISRKNIGAEITDEVDVRIIPFDDVITAEKVTLVVNSIRYRDQFVEEDLDSESFSELIASQIKDKIGSLIFGNDHFLELEISTPQSRIFVVELVIKGPSRPFVVDERTKIEFRRASKFIEILTWDDIGGLDKEIDQIREAVELPIKYKILFEHMHLDPPRGILLYGPPGTGKTLIAKVMASTMDYHFKMIDGAGIISRVYGESEERLKNAFLDAEENAPSIIFIDELDALAPKRSEVVGQLEKRLVAQLLALMDGVRKNEKQVIIIGATNRLEDIDNALRRPGRFETEILIGVPDEEGRKQILDIHLRNTPMGERVNLKKIAGDTFGYVGADLAGLVRKGKFKSIRKVIRDIDDDVDITPEILENLKLKKDDLKRSLMETEPSAMRQFLVEIPKVKMKDIGGLKQEISRLKECTELPLKHPERFKKIGIKPPSGILLFGPPGCGKTLLAKAIATESKANFMSIKGPQFMSKWVGESEKAVRMAFSKAKQVSPCIIFFDEIDSLIPTRGMYHDNTRVTERVVAQMLTELDGAESRDGVVTIFATNRPDILDPAMLRPGRIDRVIYVPPPDEEGRVKIFKIYLKKMSLSPNISVDKLAEITKGYSGADINALCTEAGMIAIRNNEEIVDMGHFEESIDNSGPSITPDILKFYEELNKRLTSRRRVKVKEFTDVV